MEAAERELIRLSLAAVNDGHAIEAVAQAAAVVPSTIREWQHNHEALALYRAWLSRS